MKCPHPKTVVLYAQRKANGKRAFKPEGRKCEACGTVLESFNQADKGATNGN